MARSPEASLLLLLFFLPTTHGDQPRYVVENGITYLETRGIEKRPVADTRVQDRTETVYKTEYITELREETRTTWVPVTEYTYQPRWHNWWNPFVQPSVSYETRPVVRWQPRTETVRVPVTVQKVTPETRIVQTPVRTLGFVEREFVERVVVNSRPSPAPQAGSTIIARQPPSVPAQPRLPSRSDGSGIQPGVIRR